MKRYQIGDVIDKYKIVREIGKGSFGVVYEAVREEGKHSYRAAIKVISISKDDEEYDDSMLDGLTEDDLSEYYSGLVDELIEECALMEDMKGDSHIVSYEDHHLEADVGKGEWTIIIRMELLAAFQKGYKLLNEPMSEKDVIKLGIDICRALETCEKKNNVIHRDIKPENIFVSKTGNYKLGDFGIAKVLGEREKTASKKGTEPYMAPEVFKGQPYDLTVDIYSLGLVLYRLMNRNRAPFLPPFPEKIKHTDNKDALLKRINGGMDFNPPQDASHQFAQVILKACAYNPHDRYSHAQDMRRDLEKIVGTDIETDYPTKLWSKMFEGESESETGTVNNFGDDQGNASNVPPYAVPPVGDDVAGGGTVGGDYGQVSIKEIEAKRRAEEEARRRAKEEARQRAEEEARQRAEEEARQRAEEEARQRAEEEARRRAEEEAKRRAEEEARQRAEEEAKQRAEEEARRQEEEAKRLVEEAKRKEYEAKGEDTSQGGIRLKTGASAASVGMTDFEDDIEPFGALGTGGEKPHVVPRQMTKSTPAAGSRPGTTSKGGSNKGKITVGLAAALLIVGISAFAVMNQKVKLPNMVGMTQAEVEEFAQKKDLSLIVQKGYSKDYEEGTVMLQDIPAGEKVEKNTQVTVTVSKGVIDVMPGLDVSYVGAEVALEFEQLGFNVSSVEVFSTIDVGHIVRYEPAAGTSLEAGANVILYISKGAASMPGVTGVQQTEAQAALDAINVAYSIVETNSTDYSPGVVISQDIAEGTEVGYGTIVNLEICVGPVMITVPSVIGVSEEEAKQTLALAGFSEDVITVSHEYDSSVASGLVKSQSLEAESSVQEGTAISIVISDGAKPVIPSTQSPKPDPDDWHWSTY